MDISDYSPILFLWNYKSVFAGHLTEKIDVSTGTSTLLIGLNRPIEFLTLEGKPVECRSLLIPAGKKIHLDTKGAFIFNLSLDPAGDELAIISKLMTRHASGVYYQLMDEQRHINGFISLCSSPLNTKKIIAIINSFIDQARGLKLENLDVSHHFERPYYTNDCRINTVVEKLNDFNGEILSLGELSRLVNLSPAYLSELFKVRIGIPIRRYRLWCRLYNAVSLIGQGKNFTDAALSSGFNDSSHFIKTYRSMVGMSPSSILTQTKPNQCSIQPSKND